jgi:hypothetical protein
MKQLHLVGYKIVSQSVCKRDCERPLLAEPGRPRQLSRLPGLKKH